MNAQVRHLLAECTHITGDRVVTNAQNWARGVKGLEVTVQSRIECGLSQVSLK